MIGFFIGKPIGGVIQTAAGELTPLLFTNTNTFYTPAVSSTYSLSPNLFVDSDTFYTPTVSATYSLVPSAYTNTNTFYTPVVSATYSLLPSLLTNTNTFYTPEVGIEQYLTPSLFTDTDTFYTPIMSIGLLPARFINTNLFAPHDINQIFVAEPRPFKFERRQIHSSRLPIFPTFRF